MVVPMWHHGRNGEGSQELCDDSLITDKHDNVDGGGQIIVYNCVTSFMDDLPKLRRLIFDLFYCHI